MSNSSSKVLPTECEQSGRVATASRLIYESLCCMSGETCIWMTIAFALEYDITKPLTRSTYLAQQRTRETEIGMST